MEIFRHDHDPVGFRVFALKAINGKPPLRGNFYLYSTELPARYFSRFLKSLISGGFIAGPAVAVLDLSRFGKEEKP
jgi:hypothetical protein